MRIRQLEEQSGVLHPIDAGTQLLARAPLETGEREAGNEHGEAVEHLLDQYRLGCRKQAEALLQLRGKLVYARHAKCVMAARTLTDAERCG